jgi:hypothetical protein
MGGSSNPVTDVLNTVTAPITGNAMNTMGNPVGNVTGAMNNAQLSALQNLQSGRAIDPRFNLPEMRSPLTRNNVLAKKYQVDLRTSPALLRAQQAKLGQRFDMMRDDMQAANASNRATFTAQAGAFGGLNSGALRANTQASIAGLKNQRRLYADQALAEASLQAQDMQNQVNAANQSQLINKAATLGALGQMNKYDMDKWQTKMQALGAEKSAQAMENQGKK